ncbi:Ty1/Copia family ribonuclease HI, partial [Klebsiella quasipneumoniae]|uniref:Ty1/Copia family ribonuclease HI n=1 Tax=Klebsiella quasipneumoniae TaxID=1463165 RepID=UPI0035578477
MNGTNRFEILYTVDNDFKLVGYIDSGWARSLDDRKSTSGYMFDMGLGAISWASKRQPIVAQSTAEVEYIAANATACQAIWLSKILTDLNERQEDGTTIYCDNISSIALSKNPVFHGKRKHIEIRYHFIRELVE